MIARFKPIRWFLYCTNAIVSMALLLSYLAPFTNPNIFWPIALFGLIYPVLLILNICFIIIWILRLSKFVTVSALSILIGFGFSNESFNYFNSPVEDISGTGLKVMTYNAHAFLPFDSKKDPHFITKTLAIIRKEDPDVLCIQEFYSSTTTGSVFDVLKQRYPHHYITGPELDDKSILRGVATFSKFPIVKKNKISSSSYSLNRAAVCDIRLPKKDIRVYNVHLQSFRLNTNDLNYINQFGAELKLDFDNDKSKSILKQLKKGFIKRSNQADSIRANIETCTLPFIVCGDFNDTPLSYTYHILSKNLLNSFVEKGYGYSSTYSGIFPNIPIDYILTDTSFAVLSYKVIKEKQSDHFPVISTVKFK